MCNKQNISNIMCFKKDFSKKLINSLPEKIKKLNLIFPDIQVGYARFNKDRLDSIYFEDIKTDDKNEKITIKFQYRDFHYIPADFIFKRLYFCKDNSNEYGFDENLNINAKYLKSPSMLNNLSLSNKIHILNILNEWLGIFQKYQKKESNYWVEAYQIEKNGERIKTLYVNNSGKELNENNYKFKKLNEFVNNFEFKNNNWFAKAFVNKDFKIKLDKNAIYLKISPNQNNKLNTNNDG